MTPALPKLSLVVALAASLGSFNPQAGAAEPEASGAGGPAASTRAGLEIVARVNGAPVTRAQFDQMVGNPITLRQAQRELGVEEPGRKALERQAMKRLVHLCLLVQEADRRKITVTQDELDQTVSAISHRFESLKDFGGWMKDQGLNDPWLFGTVHTDLLAERATEALVKEATVTEDDAQKYFEAHRDDLAIGVEVRLRVIAVRGKAEADEVYAALRKGAPFDTLARRRSVGKLAAKGGDSGWVRFQTLPQHLRDAAAELKPGEVAEPLKKSEDEFLIVGLQDRRPIVPKTLAEARPEIERRLLPAKQREFLQAWLKEQEAKSKIEILLPTGDLCAEKNP